MIRNSTFGYAVTLETGGARHAAQAMEALSHRWTPHFLVNIRQHLVAALFGCGPSFDPALPRKAHRFRPVHTLVRTYPA